MSEEKKDFIIKDRRIFAEESPEQKDEEEKKDTSDQKTVDQSDDQAAAEEAPAQEDEPETPLPEINFSTFIFSLNASALVHLGAIEDPATGQKVKNLPPTFKNFNFLRFL